MRVGLLAVDSNYPNLALMKISAWFKGYNVYADWYNPFDSYDYVYKSKIFTFTEDYEHPINNAEEVFEGGTGYSLTRKLPTYIEIMRPDYSIYPSIDKKTAYGFITRGCPNHCKWCVVPEKEGGVKPYMDVEDIAFGGRTNLILMDNNILASDYGIKQIEKIVDMRYRVDFNQGLDARLVTNDIASLLSKVRWINQIRFGCDTQAQIRHCMDAIRKIDDQRKNPAYYLLYTILDGDINECYDRLSYFRSMRNVVVHAQPFRDPHGRNIIPMWQKDMAQWANRREFYKSTDFKDFSPRIGFKCKEYFKQ